MKKKEKDAQSLRAELFARYPQLTPCQSAFDSALTELLACYRRGGKLLVAGNGGSAADSEHVAGELMKSFLFLRRPDQDMVRQLTLLFGEEGTRLADILEGAFPVIPLTTMPAVTTAYANDVEPDACFAQMVNGLGRAGDVFLGITTSGNSRNIVLAIMTAKARGMRTILLTGRSGGVCRGIADVSICVEEEETFKIQELHLPVYHTICAMLEAELFQEKPISLLKN